MTAKYEGSRQQQRTHVGKGKREENTTAPLWSHATFAKMYTSKTSLLIGREINHSLMLFTLCWYDDEVSQQFSLSSETVESLPAQQCLLCFSSFHFETLFYPTWQ